jgi:hypothetical protein
MEEVIESWLAKDGRAFTRTVARWTLHSRQGLEARSHLHWQPNVQSGSSAAKNLPLILLNFKIGNKYFMLNRIGFFSHVDCFIFIDRLALTLWPFPGCSPAVMNSLNGDPGQPTDLKNLNRTFSSLRINQDRLMRCIHQGCEFGQAHRYGRSVKLTALSQPF